MFGDGDLSNPGATFRSVRSALENSDLWDDGEASFGLVDSAEKIWEWLQGPVVDLAYTDENNTCVRCATNIR